MRVFSRTKDIVASNVNAMLDKVEDPRKLVNLMIQDMNDILVKTKRVLAGVIADKKQIERDIKDVVGLANDWSESARLAVQKHLDDLAREAIIEKQRYLKREEGLKEELSQIIMLISEYNNEIIELENVLIEASEKQRLLIQKHAHAKRKKEAQTYIRKFETSDIFDRFRQFEARIDQTDAEATLVNLHRKPKASDVLSNLKKNEAVENELATLKANAI